MDEIAELIGKIKQEKDRLRELESQCREQKVIVSGLVTKLQKTCSHSWVKNRTGKACELCGKICADWIF
jgi:hypothetical protein